MFFDDETIYGGHLCPHTYENEDKNKKCWIWIVFICKDLHCDVKFKWTEKKKESKKKKKLCAETTIHNINVLQWFDSF